ncbi:MAG: hypothetical protein IIC74_05890 [Bacteroidetes bacterium]|nr:hypothetical protein [Bacteroidota bacterium]
MLKIFLAVVIIIGLTIGIVYVIDKYLPKKLKPAIMLVLWILIGYFGYITIMSVYGEIKFNKLKVERYKVVIESLKDIRDAELAHRTVTGKFQGNWDDLIKFIDTAQFTITQRRDSTIIDVEATRRFGGVETTMEIVIIDTLGYVSVKDSLFGIDDRYKTMMNIPVGKAGEKFELQAGFIEQSGFQIAVFEAKALKSIILDGQDKDLILQENQVLSVEAVNGDAIKVGSMEEVSTNGNWPKNYSSEQ